jgi:hypothetical protein
VGIPPPTADAIIQSGTSRKGDDMKTIEHRGQSCRVVDETQAFMFRILSEDEEAEFRSMADKENEGTPISPLWHPVYQDQLFINGKGVE